MKLLNKILLIVRDELETNKFLCKGNIDLIINNLKIRLEKNLVLPESKKLKGVDNGALSD